MVLTQQGGRVMTTTPQEPGDNPNVPLDPDVDPNAPLDPTQPDETENPD